MFKSKTIKVIGYILFFLIVFLLSLQLTFPYQKLSPYLEDLGKKYIKLDIKLDEIGPNLPIGLKVKDVHIYGMDHAPQGTSVTISSLRLRPLFIPLLTGSYGVGMKGRLYDGVLKSTACKKGEGWEVNLNLDDVDLSKIDLIKAYKIEFGGSFNGRGNFLLANYDFSKINGQADIKLSGFSVGKIKVGVFEMPDIYLGDLSGNLEITKGKAVIKEAFLRGGDINSEISGSVILRKAFMNSLLKIKIKFKPLGLLDKQFGIILKTFLKRKDKNGFYTLNLEGPLYKVNLKPR